LRRALGVLAPIACLPLAACATGPSWKEEVVMFDGSKVIVERQAILGNVLDQELSDVRHGPPVKGNRLRAPTSNGAWSETWEAMGLGPQAIGRVRGSWYLSATPMLCEDYDKWGRPVPPYVFFTYSGNRWQRITVDEFPSEITRRNLTYPGSYDHRQAAGTGFISVERAKLLNPRLPDYINNVYRSGTIYEWDDCRQRLEVLDRNRKPK
jgi:hypothetical protein